MNERQRGLYDRGRAVTPTWRSDDPPPPARIGGIAGWLRAVPRGVALALVTFGGLLLLSPRPACRGAAVHGLHRPWTPWITQGVCRTAFAILGMSHRVRGAQMREPGAVVANHSSWLDIFALNARKRVYFVSKAEVARWPGIGWLARAHGDGLHQPRPEGGQGPAGAVRGAAEGRAQAPVLPRGHLDRRTAHPAVQVDALRRLLRAGSEGDPVGPAGDGDLHGARGRGSALLRLVG